jgi:uncharacterized protein (DUF2252 family)
MRDRSLVGRIERFHIGRDRERLALKYKAMKKDAHAFFRGTCHLFFEDWPRHDSLNNAPPVWACGDLHVENFGTYRGDNRRLYFDIADFDEALLAPCTWDLARLLASILVAAKAFGLGRKLALGLCDIFLDAYCWALRDGKARWIERDLARGLIKSAFNRLDRKTPSDFIRDRTVRGSGATQLLIDKEHTLPISHQERQRVREFMRAFAQEQKDPLFFRELDVARRIAGTGSLGVERYTILIDGGKTPATRFLLDLKAATPSALAPYAPTRQPRWKSEAHRVVKIQRRAQAISPALLQPVQIDSKPYVISELMPTQDKIELKKTNATQEQLDVLARDAGLIVGWSELRSGGRDGSATIDELHAFWKRRKLCRALVEYAQSYAGVAYRDWKEFSEAYYDGAFDEVRRR